ncbi:hypothetical protein GP486_001376 [Trichoglossum hirsutum]|uniref:Uncharacterized protein n=1 Tax=Trichoglossum hirsutum TaxID=265104 RepID=A0A9P8RT39_9PEZI|nr:hypothetical protein GP486_001376 [Trichoglossum hirsutum]
MQFKILAVALLGSTALAQQSPAPTAPPTPDQFASAVAALVASYIPSSVLIPLGSAVQSAANAAGITGNIQDILNQALTGTAPPPWLTAIPSQYQPNILSLESAISQLKASVLTAAGSAAPSGAPTNSLNATSGSAGPSKGSAGKTGTTIAPTSSRSPTSSSSSAAAMPAVVVPGAAGIFGILGVIFAL